MLQKSFIPTTSFPLKISMFEMMRGKMHYKKKSIKNRRCESSILQISRNFEILKILVRKKNFFKKSKKKTIVPHRRKPFIAPKRKLFGRKNIGWGWVRWSKKGGKNDGGDLDDWMIAKMVKPTRVYDPREGV